MCNLHDVSWGNRPTSTGAEAFTANKNDQEKIKGDYMVFRTNFVIFWLIANIVYYIMITEFVSNEKADGSYGYLEYFSMVLAFLVLFRFFFGALYICSWKCKYCCCPKYKIQEQNLIDEFKNIKKRSVNNGELSTDDEEMEEHVNTIFRTNEQKIRDRDIKRGGDGKFDDRQSLASSSKHSKTGDMVNIHDETIAFMHEEGKDEFSDSDDDFREFDDADKEEAEDRIY